MRPIQFAGTLLAGHKGAAVEVPFNPAEKWEIPAAPLWKGRRGHVVAATVNGVACTSAIVPRSGKFWLLVEEAVMMKAKTEVGKRVRVGVSAAVEKG